MQFGIFTLQQVLKVLWNQLLSSYVMLSADLICHVSHSMTKDSGSYT